MDLFSQATPIGVPQKIEVKGRVYRSSIEKRGPTAFVRSVYLTSYATRGLRGLTADIEPFGKVLFLPRKSSAELPFEQILVAPDFVTEADLSKKSLDGQIRWVRGAARKPAELSIEEAGAMCERARASWKDAFTFRREVRDTNGEIIEKGLGRVDKRLQP